MLRSASTVLLVSCAVSALVASAQTPNSLRGATPQAVNYPPPDKDFIVQLDTEAAREKKLPVLYLAGDPALPGLGVYEDSRYTIATLTTPQTRRNNSDGVQNFRLRNRCTDTAYITVFSQAADGFPVFVKLGSRQEFVTRVVPGVYYVGVTVRDSQLYFRTELKASTTSTYYLVRDEESFTPVPASAIGRSASNPSKPIERAALPSFQQPLAGGNEIRVRNPNEYAVSVQVRTGTMAKNFDVPARGVSAISGPNGAYEIFFIYANQPEALYQGDDFRLAGNGVEIDLVSVVDGNYNVKRVK